MNLKKAFFKIVWGINPEGKQSYRRVLGPACAELAKSFSESKGILTARELLLLSKITLTYMFYSEVGPKGKLK